jgi:hypothetical protein
MKTFFILVYTILLFTQTFSQHILISRTGDTLKGKVIEVSQTEIKFTQSTNPDSPLYTVNKSDIIMIDYNNGTKEFFQNSGNTFISTSISSNISYSFSSSPSYNNTTNSIPSNNYQPTAVNRCNKLKTNLLFDVILPLFVLILDTPQSSCKTKKNYHHNCSSSCNHGYYK